MKRLILIIAGGLVALSSCREKISKQNSGETNENTALVAEENDLVAGNEYSKKDYLAALQDICVEDNGVFKNCDELFGQDGSAYFFLIIPKAGAQTWYEAASKDLKGPTYERNDSLKAKIQNIDKDKLSKDFDVWVFYTDRKYTKHVGMDAAYNIINPHTTELYYLRSGKNNWKKLEIFSVNNDNEVQNEIQWREDFINKAIRQSNQNPKNGTASMAVSEAWNGKYSAYFGYGDIAGQNVGWALDITITSSKITATGEGYQMAFSDELSAKESGSELVLKHSKHISGYPSGQKMNPEFILIKDAGKFYIKSRWISEDVITKPAGPGYPIDKADL